ncbi:MAG: IPT/TIG domain-containing protein [Gemmatimonadaceae bacterium]|nr:IPT/TIG domain-containing protein [Gemmatimonadaceae bacterium]
MSLRARAAAAAPAYARLALLVACTITLTSCGGGDEDKAPRPRAVSLGPEMVAMGSGATTVTLTGSGFTPQSRLLVAEVPRTMDFVSSTSLRFTMTEVELSSLTGYSVTVTNAPPGGGTSDTLYFVVGNALPAITSGAMTPVVPELPGDTITVTGTGFQFNSQVWLSSGRLLPVLAQTRTTLKVRLGIGVDPAAYTLRVENPPPGGGSSNAVPFTVANRVPVLQRVYPDSMLTGQEFRDVRVTGIGFTPRTTFLVGGSQRPATFGSDSLAVVTLAAGDVAAPGTLLLTARNPEPTAGASAALPVAVRTAPPVIGSFAPASLVAGSATTSVAITGSGFDATSEVLWNGAVLPTHYVSALQLDVTVDAARLAVPQAATVVVRTGARSSTPSSYGILGGTATLDPPITLDMLARDVAWVASRNRLYVSVASGPATNTVLAVDPATGAITARIALASEPGALAASADGRYLYVAYTGRPTVGRIDLDSGTEDLSITIGAPDARALDLAPIPGSPRAVLVTRSTPGNHIAPQVYDDAVARPVTPGSDGESSRIEVISATEAIGYNHNSSDAPLRRYRLAPDGMTVLDLRTSVVPGSINDFQYAAGRLYFSNGDVLDAATFARIGTLPGSVPGYPMQVVADVTQGRAYAAVNATLRTYTFASLSPLTSTPSPAIGYASRRMVRWGTSGLALVTDTQLVILRGSLIGS